MQDTYIERLVAAMKTGGYSDSYIALCCGYAASLIDKDLPVIFDSGHLGRILQLHECDHAAYICFSIEKKGKKRIVNAPVRPLKLRQEWILHHILSKQAVSDNAHGFVKGRSIVSHAKKHLDQPYVLCMDIRDFFRSIKYDSVRQVFYGLGYTSEVAAELARLCCFENCLPQGAPTSPYIANLFCRGLDKELSDIASRKEAVYTRYADDIVFSSDRALESCIPEIELVLAKYNFGPNSEKTRIFKPGDRKRITGLIVTDILRVPKQFKRTLKQEIYYCQKFGVSAHLENKGASKYIHYREHLYGKAYYIHMVEPEAGRRFLAQLDMIQWP